jgi:glycosyltransferase involved in cell wall biosynthesis
MEWYYRIVPQLSAQKATVIITVSNASKQSITRYLRIPEERLFVTYEAPANVFRPIENRGAIETVRNKYGLDSEFILGLGSADPRKNINTLVKAYAMLPASLKEQYQLAIIWNHKALEFFSSAEAEKAGVLGRLCFLENVTDDELAALYGIATAFVFPSFEEGFGLPPLEAMACGAVVLAANNSSIPEIVENAALLFEADNTWELTDLLVKALSDLDLRNEMKVRGIQRAGDFSWRRCAIETIDVYKKVMIMSNVRG